MKAVSLNIQSKPTSSLHQVSQSSQIWIKQNHVVKEHTPQVGAQEPQEPLNTSGAHTALLHTLKSRGGQGAAQTHTVCIMAQCSTLRHTTESENKY